MEVNRDIFFVYECFEDAEEIREDQQSDKCNPRDAMDISYLEMEDFSCNTSSFL